MTLPLKDIALGAGVPIEQIEHGYRAQGGTPGFIPGLYPIPERFRRRSEELKENDPRLTIGLIRRALKLGSNFTEEDSQQLHNEIYGTDAMQQLHEEEIGPETPQVFDYEALAPTSTDINEDGRAASTFFDSFERNIDEDPVEHTIPDQVVGPTKYTAQKGASLLQIPKVAFISDNRNPESTPIAEGVETASPETNQDSRDDRGGVEFWEGYERERQLNEGKFMPSSFKPTQLPEAKLGYDTSGVHHGSKALQGNQRSVIKNAAKKIPKNSAAPNKGYRRRVDVIVHDGEGKVLVGKSPQGGYIFPGGGLDPGENINQAAKRETREEVAWATDKPKAIKGIRSHTNVWTPKQRVENAKKDRHFLGDKTYHRVAKATKKDKSIHGADGGWKMRARFIPAQKVIDKLKASGKKKHDYAKYDRANAKALQKAVDVIEVKETIEKAAASVDDYRKRVEVIVHDGQGNVLVGDAPWGGYTFPGGGIDPGESPTQAAKRETKEEAGWSIDKPKAVKGIRPRSHPW